MAMVRLASDRNNKAFEVGSEQATEASEAIKALDGDGAIEAIGRAIAPTYREVCPEQWMDSPE
jgi:hypothetical protein